MATNKRAQSKQPVKRSVSGATKQAAVAGNRRPAAGTTASPAAARSRLASESQPALFDPQDSVDSEFSGTLYIANGQASLNGTLLLLAGVASFAAAVAAAAQALANQGFQSGQSVTVTGHTAIVHLDEHPITVIVMSGARAN